MFCFVRGKTVAEATDDILHVQLPRLKVLMSAGALRVDNIDVFCEQGVFDLDSTRSILQAGKDLGLNINFHGDELHPMNSAQVPSLVWVGGNVLFETITTVKGRGVSEFKGGIFSAFITFEQFKMPV